MLFLSTLLGILGVAIGFSIGLIIGFYFFVYSNPKDVEDPVVKPLEELNDARLEDLMSEIPLWVKKPDYERIDWLNKLIFHMWPFLDKAICSMIRSSAQLIFNEYIGKFKIQSIQFEKLTMGNLPPILHGLKLCQTNDKELVMEPTIYWAGNPNIVVTLTTSSFQVKLQLVDVQIYAEARVTLKPLVPITPFFGKLVVSLIEKPNLDFGLKILGGDVMAIPGLYHYVQETIKTEIMQLYMWPKFLEIPMLDESLIPSNNVVGMLHVKVVKAINLLKMDWFGLCDPYVKLTLRGDTLPSEKTTIKKKTLSPEWRETFMLIVKDPRFQLLDINVYDWDKVGGHDRLGMQVYPLKLLKFNETRGVELDLIKNEDPMDPQNKKQRETNNQMSGTSFTKSPHGAGLLSVTIQGAKDVEGVHHTNLYVLILFKGEQRKSKSKTKTHNPCWDEEFQFKLDNPPLAELIRIKVMSKRKGISLQPKESLGYVDINLADVVSNGRINNEHHLIDSNNGIICVELEWKPIREPMHDNLPHQTVNS